VKKIAFSLVVALAVLEPVARLWVHFDPTSTLHEDVMTWDTDPEILFRPRPGTSAAFESGPINAVGLRGPEIDPIAPHRVLMMGDSVGFGVHVPEPETMARVAERQLGKGWQVMNASVTGYQTWQERRYLERLDPIFAPTEVVVVFCTNDTVKLSQMLEWSAYYEHQEPILDAIQPSPIGLVWAARYVVALRKAAEYRREVEANPPPLNWRGEWSDAWTALVMQAARGGRPAVAVLVPSELQLDRPGEGTSPEAAEMADAAGVRVVDLLARFRAEPRGTLYLPNDPIHLSPRGHAIAARAILAAL
jgi:lysophospholipase L1-like esterase